MKREGREREGKDRERERGVGELNLGEEKGEDGERRERASLEAGLWSQ